MTTYLELVKRGENSDKVLDMILERMLKDEDVDNDTKELAKRLLELTPLKDKRAKAMSQTL